MVEIARTVHISECEIGLPAPTEVKVGLPYPRMASYQGRILIG